VQFTLNVSYQQVYIFYEKGVLVHLSSYTLQTGWLAIINIKNKSETCSRVMPGGYAAGEKIPHHVISLCGEEL